MYKSVIFDLDGTILNTLEDLADAGNYALEQQGLPIHDTEKYKYFVGNGIPKLIERILPFDADNSLKDSTLRLFNSYYSVHMNDKTQPYDGVVDMLTVLKSKGIYTVVVTNKSNEFAPGIIQKYFGELIDKVYGSVEGYPKKPDPFWVERAIADSELNKDDVLYVGDSNVDMQTAFKSGLVSCGVLWGFRTKEELVSSGAVHICETCSDILNIVFG